MNCNKCGFNNPDGAPACSNCGTPLPPVHTGAQQAGGPLPGASSSYGGMPQPPYGGQSYYGGMPQPRNNNSVLLIVIIVLLVLLIGGVGAYFIFGNDPAPAPAPVPGETATKTVHDTVVVHTQTVVPVAPAATPSTSSKTVRRDSGNSANRASGGDYSWICYTRLSGSDLAGLSRSELRVMRNTIYARHGYIFSSADLNNYFSRFSWYNPYTKVVPDRELSSVEKHNINLIKSYE